MTRVNAHVCLKAWASRARPCTMELAALQALCPGDSVRSHAYRHPQTQIYDFPDSSSAQSFLLWFWKHFFHFKYILLHVSIQQRFIETLPKILCETES